jgi:exodeoxyribonuclease VII small subunit
MVKKTQQAEMALSDHQSALQQNAAEITAGTSFETAIKELESIVSQMESNQLPLEQSLSAFKRGTALLQFCQQTLSNVEQQVRILNDAQQLQPYTNDDATR